MDYVYDAVILRVVDGDTVDAMVDLGFDIQVSMKFRLYGINAPELKEDAGKIARDRLKAKIEGTKVLIFTIKDKREKYGRYLADIQTKDGVLITQWLVEEGLAKFQAY